MIEYEEITRISGDPLARLKEFGMVVAAKKGVDIVRMARRWWSVCTGCERMCHDSLGISACCHAATRIQGWAS